MQTEFSEDQEQFREVVVRFLQDKSTPSAVRQLMTTKTGYDPEVWQQLSQELGLCGTHIPESCGGFGFGPIELGITAEAMGRHLYSGPFFSSAVMAGYTLLLGADETAREKLLPGIAAGSTIATAVFDNLDSPDLVGMNLMANERGITGRAAVVIDAHCADLFVVVANSVDGLGVYALSAETEGVTVQELSSLDPTRRIGSVSFEDAVADRVGTVDRKRVAAIWDHICVALAHEMIGGAQHLLESTVEYTGIRYQFGRPIGSFQALKHRCADLLMEVEIAKAATHHAARCLDAGEGEIYAPAMAKALASDTYMKAAKEAIQLRGGIGFTWEEDTQLWYKRAKSSEVFMGKPDIHRERMISLMEQMEQEQAS